MELGKRTDGIARRSFFGYGVLYIEEIRLYFNKNMVEKFKPMVRKAFSAFINDIVNQKLNEVFDTM